MKKTRYIQLIALLAILSCTNDEEKILHEVSVSFNPVLQENTRSTNGDTYPADTPFGVWAFSLPANKRWADDAPAATTYMDREVVSYSSGSWQPSVPYQWKSNIQLTFFAYSPAWLDASYNSENGITVADHDIDSDSGFMFTHPQSDNNNLYNYGCVSLPFVNALAKIKFNVRSKAALGRTLHLKHIYMDTLAHKGTFHSLPEAHWTTTGDCRQQDIFKGDLELGSAIMEIGSMMAMPKTTKQPIKLMIDIYNMNGQLVIADRAIETVSPTGAWKVGKYYEYTIDVYSDSATFTTDYIPEDL